MPDYAFQFTNAMGRIANVHHAGGEPHALALFAIHVPIWPLVNRRGHCEIQLFISIRREFVSVSVVIELLPIFNEEALLADQPVPRNAPVENIQIQPNNIQRIAAVLAGMLIRIVVFAFLEALDSLLRRIVGELPFQAAEEGTLMGLILAALLAAIADQA